MARKKPQSMGQAISTFSFILFGLLLALAALAEENGLKSGMLGLCATLSIAGAARFKIQYAFERFHARDRRQKRD